MAFILDKFVRSTLFLFLLVVVIVFFKRNVSNVSKSVEGFEGDFTKIYDSRSQWRRLIQPLNGHEKRLPPLWEEDSSPFPYDVIPGSMGKNPPFKPETGRGGCGGSPPHSVMFALNTTQIGGPIRKPSCLPTGTGPNGVVSAEDILRVSLGSVTPGTTLNSICHT